jgi:hypothetical protein
MGIPIKIISAVDTIANLSGCTMIQIILQKLGFAKFISWVFWVSMII